MENNELQQSFSKEIKDKQMLSLQNEQLQFKLKQNTEVVNALAANMSDFHDVSGERAARCPFRLWCCWHGVCVAWAKLESDVDCFVAAILNASIVNGITPDRSRR